MFMGLFTHWDLLNPLETAATAYQTGNTALLVHTLREYCAAIAGAVGWIALFSLCALCRRRWSALPKWVPVGCACGVAAVLLGPYYFAIAIPPVSLAISVLLLIKMRDKQSFPQAV